MEYRQIKEITINCNNKRRPINNIERNKKKSGKLYPYYGANGIVDYINEYSFEEECLCVAEDGGSWGKKEKCSYIANGKYWVNNHAHVLKMTDKIKIEYLMYYLNNTDLNSYITGTTRGKLTLNSIEKIKVPVPSLENQNKIIVQLKLLDGIKEKQQEQLENIEKLKKFRFIELFGDPIRNEKGWEVKKISETMKIIMGQSPPSESYNLDKIGLPFYQGSSDFGKKYPKLNKFCSSPKKIAKENSILMSVRAPVGDINICIQDCCIGRGLCSIQFEEKKMELEYVYNYFKLILKKIKGNEKGSTFKSINRQEIENLEIIIPPLSLQQKFAGFIEEADKLKVAIEKSLMETEQLYNALMQKYFG